MPISELFAFAINRYNTEVSESSRWPEESEAAWSACLDLARLDDLIGTADAPRSSVQEVFLQAISDELVSQPRLPSIPTDPLFPEMDWRPHPQEDQRAQALARVSKRPAHVPVIPLTAVFAEAIANYNDNLADERDSWPSDPKEAWEACLDPVRRGEAMDTIDPKDPVGQAFLQAMALELAAHPLPPNVPFDRFHPALAWSNHPDYRPEQYQRAAGVAQLASAVDWSTPPGASASPAYRILEAAIPAGTFDRIYAVLSSHLRAEDQTIAHSFLSKWMEDGGHGDRVKTDLLAITPPHVVGVELLSALAKGERIAPLVEKFGDHKKWPWPLPVSAFFAQCVIEAAPGFTHADPSSPRLPAPDRVFPRLSKVITHPSYPEDLRENLQISCYHAKKDLTRLAESVSSPQPMSSAPRRLSPRR